MSGFQGDLALSRTVALVLRLQIILAGALMLAVLAWAGASPALATLFGSGLGILGTIMAARGVRRAGGDQRASDTPSLVPVYLGALQKLLVVAAGVAFGLVVLELSALFLLGGLILSQVGYVVASVWSMAGDR